MVVSVLPVPAGPAGAQPSTRWDACVAVMWMLGRVRDGVRVRGRDGVVPAWR